MTTKVTDKGIIYPDGTEQTTAAFGSGGGSVDAYTKEETDDKFYDKEEINNLLEASSGAIVGNYKANYPNSVARDPEAGNLYLVNIMSFTNNYDEVTSLYISKTDADGNERDLSQIAVNDIINLESDNGSGSYIIQSFSDAGTYFEFIVDRGDCSGTLAQDDDVTARLEVEEVGTGGIEEAPADGKQYARQDEAWTEVEASGGGGSPFIFHGTTAVTHPAPYDPVMGQMYFNKVAGKADSSWGLALDPDVEIPVNAVLIYDLVDTGTWGVIMSPNIGGSSGGGSGDSIWTEENGVATYDGNIKVNGVTTTDNLVVNGTSPVGTVSAHGTSSVRFTAVPTGFASAGQSSGFGVYRNGAGRKAGYSWTIDNVVSSGGSGSNEYQTDHMYFNFRPNTTSDTLTNRMKINPNGRVDITGSLYVNGENISGSVPSVPTGAIMMWSGATNTIPSGWRLCDGGGGTPDLRNRFVVGAGSTYALAAKGGSANAIIPTHKHTGTVTVNTKTGLDGTLTLINRGGSSGANSLMRARSGSVTTATSGQGSYGEGWRGESGSNSSKATFKLDHNHSGSVAIANTGSSATNANLPPYIALYYIMKTSSTRTDAKNEESGETIYSNEEVDNKLAIKDKLIKQLSERLDKLEKRVK